MNRIIRKYINRHRESFISFFHLRLNIININNITYFISIIWVLAIISYISIFSRLIIQLTPLSWKQFDNQYVKSPIGLSQSSKLSSTNNQNLIFIIITCSLCTEHQSSESFSAESIIEVSLTNIVTDQSNAIMNFCVIHQPTIYVQKRVANSTSPTKSLLQCHPRTYVVFYSDFIVLCPSSSSDNLLLYRQHHVVLRILRISSFENPSSLTENPSPFVSTVTITKSTI